MMCCTTLNGYLPVRHCSISIAWQGTQCRQATPKSEPTVSKNSSKKIWDPCSHQRRPLVGSLMRRNLETVMLLTESGQTSASTEKDNARKGRKVPGTFALHRVYTSKTTAERTCGRFAASCLRC